NLLVEQLGGRTRVVIRDRFSQVPAAEFTNTPLRDALSVSVPAEYQDLTSNDVPPEGWAAILEANLSPDNMLDVVNEQIIQPRVITSWTLLDSIFQRGSIEAQAAEKYPDDTLQFRSWISWDFITSSISSSATTAGQCTALLGSFWIILITATTALIVGISAAIYLEEYASDKNPIARLIGINIRNLAAIPSVIYGMLGLAVFVRALGDFTSGAAFGITDTNGRTGMSAGLTLP